MHIFVFHEPKHPPRDPFHSSLHACGSHNQHQFNWGEMEKRLHRCDKQCRCCCDGCYSCYVVAEFLHETVALIALQASDTATTAACKHCNSQ